MDEEHYRVVEHDGGWAYTAKGVFSETFRSREAALAAARRAVAEQQLPDRTRVIQYQDESGAWRTEIASGDDRPVVDVED